jgi:hypothetical protein
MLRAVDGGEERLTPIAGADVLAELFEVINRSLRRALSSSPRRLSAH